jgi:hypothetical protein
VKIRLPEHSSPITQERTNKVWYNFFNNAYIRLIGYFDATLKATLLKDTDTEGNVLATETSISNYLIKQTNLNGNEVIDIFVGGTFATNGNNKTLRLKLNATTIYTNTVATNGGSWQVHAKVINLGASQKNFIENGGTSTYLTSAIDTSTTNIDIILTLQGAASDDIVKEYFQIDYNA